MATRKKRPVFFEVYRPPTKTSDPTLKPRPSKSWPEADRPPPTSGSESDVRARSSDGPVPTESSATGRWQMTVSAPTLAIAVAGLAVLLAVAFSAGQRYEAFHSSVSEPTELAQGPELDADAGTQEGSVAVIEAADADQEGGGAPAETATPDRATGQAAQHTADKPPQVTLWKGYHYVVVQHFGKKRERQAAQAAAGYLRESGVACATLTGADVRVVVTEPFLINQEDRAAARRERDRADRLIARVRRLGQEYNKQLLKQGEKGYTFSQCYLFEIK